MYQYEICPFCNKIKAVLDFHKVPYKTIEVNPLTKSELSFTKDLPEDHPAHKYRKVPLVRIGGDVVADSPVVLDRLVEGLGKEGVIGAAQMARDYKDPKVAEWVRWADKELAVLLFPNLTRTLSESYQAFGYVDSVPHFSFLDKVSNRMAGSLAMWLAQGKIKKKYGITDERAALRASLDRWTDAIGKSDFLGGASPNLADLCVFGTLRSIEGLETHAIVLRETQVGPWYERMAGRVGPRNGSRADRE